MLDQAKADKTCPNTRTGLYTLRDIVLSQISYISLILDLVYRLCLPASIFLLLSSTVTH